MATLVCTMAYVLGVLLSMAPKRMRGPAAASPFVTPPKTRVASKAAPAEEAEELKVKSEGEAEGDE